MKKLLLLMSFVLIQQAYAQLSGVNIMTGLAYPVCFTIADDGRYFISLKGGSGFSAPEDAMVNVYNSNGSLQATLWDFTDSVETYFERGVLGVELDPDFANNHYVYVFYNHASPAMIRVMRFTETNGVGSDPFVVFEVNDPSPEGNHTGGNIHFAPSDSDHLFISIGDRADVPAEAQDLSLWNGKMLRVHKNGSIPTDNPFYDDGDPAVGNDDRIWAWGLRNSFDFCFNPSTDTMYATENGQNTYDEFNVITKGKNYGWPNCEGISGSCTGFTAPLSTWGAPLPAVTGALFYTGTVMTNYTNHLIVTDYNNGYLWNIELGNAPAYNTFVSKSVISGLNYGAVIDIEQGLEGCFYIIDGGYTPNGKLIRICPTGFGIEDQFNTLGIEAYPNPTNDILHVNGVNELTVYKITDVSGRVVLNGSMNGNTELDLSSLPASSYTLVLSNEHFTASSKVIKY